MGYITQCVVLLSFCSLQIKGEQKYLDLDGNEWQLSDEAGRVKYIEATVPGVVHMDLLKRKIIDDPYYGFNDDSQQWVGYSNWVYITVFELSSLDDFKGWDLFLKCDGIDTVANVSLNSVPVGYANNYHRQWLFDITDSIGLGDNLIKIRIESAANYSLRMWNAYPVDVGKSDKYFPDSSRNFVRKTQSDFGWDWGPGFVPAGIWQSVSVVFYKNIYIQTIVPKPFYENTSDSYMIEVLVCVNLKRTVNYRMTVTLSVPKTPFETSKQWDYVVNQTGETCSRMLTDPVKSADMDQYLWKPYSSSSKTPLLFDAQVTVDVMDESGSKISTVDQSRRIGFRNIQIVQDPPPDNESGLLFYFSHSDSKGSYPIYAKGSNFIPMDAFISRATPDVARKLLTSAVMGNQNMIRVWGGGLYQPNWFYDICDELGIMVWQEFMFGDAQYPRDKAFLATVKQEVIDTVRRLGYHPSIVLWSGNNENQAGAKTTAQIIDYSALYDTTIRATLWEEDTSRPYWPSSPSNGATVDDKDMGLYIQRWGYSGNSSIGDIHRYDYTDLCTDVKKFPRPRFASEFGFQSYPSFASLQRVSGPSDWDNNSPFMNHRQHHPNGNQQLEDMMKKFFHLPNSSNKTVAFQDFVYLTQVVQSLCITAEAEHYRRIMSEYGYTRGTLYWQLNDIWQAQSWATIEYAGRWKLLHYGMKRVYAEFLVSAYEMDGVIGIYIANDQPGKTVKCNLKVSVIRWKDGSTVNTFSNNSLTSEGFTGVRVFNEKVSDIFKGTSVNESFLYITVTEADSGALLSDEAFYPLSFTAVDLPQAHITVSNIAMSKDDSSSVKFTLSSSAVAPYVYLNSGEIEGFFSDNGMLVFPGVQYNMTFTSWQTITVQSFKDNFSTRSIRDTY